jgi:RNA polymerase sigma factor (TIGR02999 family)
MQITDLSGGEGVSGEITRALNDDRGPRLDDAVYADLRDLARRELRRLGGRRTLNPTALVNEAWLKLAAGHAPWDSRAHFLSAMARVMRHVLIDYAREQGALRRGGEALRVTLDDSTPDMNEAADVLEVLAIHRALLELARLDPRLEQVIELRFFAGLTIPEIAEVMNCSEPTVKRDLRAARAYIAATMDTGA